LNDLDADIQTLESIVVSDLMSPQAEKKQKMLDRVAEENGVAVVVLDENSHEVSVSNNNSICRNLTSSPEFAPKCAEYCGMAFRKTASGAAFEYKCYAGLTCKAVPVANGGNRFVAIVGRTFTAADDYRKATERAITGDWSDLSPNEFFENVLMGGSASNIERATGELSKYRASRADNALELDVPQASPAGQTHKPKPLEKPRAKAERINKSNVRPKTSSPEKNRRVAQASALRSLHGRLGKLGYNAGCEAVLEFLRWSFGLESLVWLEQKDNRFIVAAALGGLRQKPITIGIAADNTLLVSALRKKLPLQLSERAPDGSPGQGRTLNLFASIVGGEIRGALGVEGDIEPERAVTLMRFCDRIGPQLEIRRLNREILDREWLNRATARFTESLKRIDTADFWTHVTQVSAELVQSERASLLVRNEGSEGGLRAKAVVGSRVNLFAEPHVGGRVSRLVLDAGKPVVVGDIDQTGIKSAPREWKYKTNSFISYPIVIGDRGIAVMNFTDKAGGSTFDERDLSLLHAIAPHIAVAMDRTSLKDMASEFEQLSVTDALTGLLNRRYLEKRLSEEIQRSKRHRFPMSIMMLDVDEFKSYNDAFGHPAGDTALKIVAGVLKDILRGADVAARYGGEEFAILLPQTTSNEAAVIAERLRQRIEHTEFPKRKVTVSIGIASCSSEIDTPEDIIGAADHALYEAKNHGRNNVQIYEGFGKPFDEKIH
jgi:diguanylate cyclase (GGDEF)-like protein